MSRHRRCLDCGARYEPGDPSRCPEHAAATLARIDAARRARRGSRYGSAYRTARARVLAESTVCWICGRPGSDTVDHVVPVARGGSHDAANLRPAHLGCNSSRGAGRR